MHLILNSDVLRAGDYLGDAAVPDHHRRVYEQCAALGGTVHLPRTSLLEFERMMEEEVSKRQEELESNFRDLDRYGIEYVRKEPSDLISIPDLPRLIRDTGVEVVVEALDDAELREAHDRACLHSPPHAPNAKEGEMRDCVIWLVALRVARENGGALMISRDKLHRERHGDEEAGSVNLVRVKEFTHAFDALGIETPALSTIRSILLPIWTDLIDAGVPLSSTPSIRGSENEMFRNSETGLAQASADITAESSSGSVLTARVKIDVQGSEITKVAIQDVIVGGLRVGDDRLTIPVNRQSEVLPSSSVEQDVEALRKFLEK